MINRQFNQEILNFALELVTEQLGNESHVEQRFQICGLLISAGARIMSHNQQYTVFHKSIILPHLCCYYGNNKILKQLMSSFTKEKLKHILEYEYKIKTFDNETPLMYSVRRGHHNCVKVIMKCLRDHHIVEELSQYIGLAAEAGHLHILKYMLQYYQTTKSSHILKPLPIISALRNKHFQCAELLVKYCSDITPPLCESENEDEWEYVVSTAIECSHNSLKHTLVSLASSYNWNCVKYLLQDMFVDHFDINATYASNTLLGLVVRYCKVNILEQLLKNDIDINKADGLGKYPITSAICEFVANESLNHWKVLKLLIVHGCDVDIVTPDENGIRQPHFSPVGFVVNTRIPEVLAILVLAGADLSQVPAETYEYQEEELDYLWPDRAHLVEDNLMDRAEDEDVDVDIKNILRNHEQVSSLQHLSRLSVRSALKSNSPIIFHKLRGLFPDPLIEYLKLADIDKIETKYDLDYTPRR